jgi:hypothetical protein
VFGAGGHQFRLLDPLTHQELTDLEGQLGVRLPDDYREFLLQVGAGGAGPAYGVFPVQKGRDGRWEWVGDGANMTQLDRLTDPFPVTAPNFDALEALWCEFPEREDFEDQAAYETAYDAWDERRRTLFLDDNRDVGAICLCHEGCAARVWLIVSGPEAGHMWHDYRVEDSDMGQLQNADGTPSTFADWYLGWLEEASRTAMASD